MAKMVYLWVDLVDYLILYKICSFVKNKGVLSFKFIMWKTLGKMVYLGVDLVKNEIIVLSFIELLVLDPKQSINMKDDE